MTVYNNSQLTIQDLPSDCINQICSFIPRKRFTPLFCISKQFSQPKRYFIGREAAVYNAFLKFLHSEFPEFPSCIRFTATTITGIKKFETELAEFLSRGCDSSLESTCKNKSFYPDISVVFSLNKPDYKALVANGYLAATLDSKNLSENDQSSLISLIPQFNYLLKNTKRTTEFHSQLMWYHATQPAYCNKAFDIRDNFQHIVSVVKNFQKVIALEALIEKGEPKFLEHYDSIEKLEFEDRIIYLSEMGVYFAKKGDLEGIQEVHVRIDNAILRAHTNIRFQWLKNKINEIYQSINWDKVPIENLHSMLTQHPEELYLIDRLLLLNDNESVIKYYKKKHYLVWDFLLKRGKVWLAEKLATDTDDEAQAEITIAQLRFGKITNTDALEAKLLQDPYYKRQLIKELATAYAAIGKFEKAFSLAEKIVPDQSSQSFTKFLWVPRLKLYAFDDTLFEGSGSKSTTYVEILMLCAKNNLFEAIPKYARHVGSGDIYRCLLSKIANHAAGNGNFTYLLDYLARYVNVNIDDELLEFTLRDRFDTRMILESSLSDPEKLTISRWVFWYLCRQGKIDKTIDLYHYIKDSITTLKYIFKYSGVGFHVVDNIHYMFGMACAEKGYISLALEAAERVQDQPLYHELLLNIKLNKL